MASIPPRDKLGEKSKVPGRTYSIGNLAQEFDITTRTIRFYESLGLITPQRKGASRIYTVRDRARLVLILRGKNLGFSLDDIAEYIALYDADPGQVTQTRHLLEKVEATITDLDTKKLDIEHSLIDLDDIRERCLAHLKERKKVE